MSSIEERLISPRLAADGVASLPMNDVRTKYRHRFEEDCTSGQIQLEEVTECLCHGRDFRRTVAKDRFGLPFSQLACKSCGLWSCTPRLSAVSGNYYYANIYHALNYGIEGGTVKRDQFLEGQGARIFDYVKNLLPQTDGDLHVAEIGCGSGSNLIAFGQRYSAQFGCQPVLYGCDYSVPYVEYGRKQGLNLVVGGVPAMAEYRARFDVVILSHVLEHFSDIAAELDSLRPLLKDTALVYVEVPGLCELHRKPEYDYDLLQFLTHAHVYNFNLCSLAHVMHSNGFGLIQGDESTRGVFSQGKSGSSRLEVGENYSRIVEYMERLERRLDWYKCWNPARPLHRRLARLGYAITKKVLGR